MKINSMLAALMLIASMATPSQALTRNHHICGANAPVYYGNDLNYGYTISRGTSIQVVRTSGNWTQFYQFDMDKNTTSQWVPSKYVCSGTPPKVNKPQTIDEYVYLYSCTFQDSYTEAKLHQCYHEKKDNEYFIYFMPEETEATLFPALDYYEEGDLVLLNGYGATVKKMEDSCVYVQANDVEFAIAYCGIGEEDKTVIRR